MCREPPKNDGVRRFGFASLNFFHSSKKPKFRVHVKILAPEEIKRGFKSLTGPRLLLDSTALHCSAGCQPPPTTKQEQY